MTEHCPPIDDLAISSRCTYLCRNDNIKSEKEHPIRVDILSFTIDKWTMKKTPEAKEARGELAN